MLENLGEQIKLVRTKSNLSQDRFGKKIGISGKTISSYETGRSFPPIRTLKKLSSEYDLHVGELSKDTLNKIDEKINKLEEALRQLRIEIDGFLSF